MEQPPILLYAVPWFVILMIAEVLFSVYEKKDLYEVKDTFAGIGLGLGNLIIGLIFKVLVLWVYSFFYEYRLFTLGFGVWIWIIGFFADDLTYYIFHRISHHVRWFWASHKVHHTSQKYNLAAAVRQTWTGQISGSFLFWIWMPFLGFHPQMVLTLQAASLIYQFWIHTEVIRKLPKPIEFIFNTPSHHRVHHAVNLQYLDKNHAGVLIIWDRMFGTFVPEEEKPIYGLVENVHTFNPIKIAIHEWMKIFNDLKSKPTKYFLNYLFRPPGWSHDGSTKTTEQLRAAHKNQYGT